MDLTDAHKVWLDGNLLPLTPEKITYEYEDRTEVITLCNGETLTVGHKDGPVTVKFEFKDTTHDYPWIEPLGRRGDWSDVFWIWKQNVYPFRFDVKRYYSKLNVSMIVLLKDWSFVEDANDNSDMTYSVTLIEYRPQTNMEINANIQHHLQQNRVAKGMRAGRI